MKEEKIKNQLLELVSMLSGGYTTNYDQVKRLLGIETGEEEYLFTRYLEELEMIGSVELLENDRIFII